MGVDEEEQPWAARSCYRKGLGIRGSLKGVYGELELSLLFVRFKLGPLLVPSRIQEGLRSDQKGPV